MLSLLKERLKRLLNDPEAMSLLSVIAILGMLAWVMVATMAPVLVSLILAFLLNALVRRFIRLGMPTMIAIWVTYAIFISVLLAVVFLLLPLMFNQLGAFFVELPKMIARGRDWFLQFAERYPLLAHTKVRELVQHTGIDLRQLGQFGKTVLSISWASVPGVVSWCVYLIIVPLLVFFFLKDRQQLIRWCAQYLPTQRSLSRRMWCEVYRQLGNYLRGKVVEGLIVGVATYLVCLGFGLHYSVLLSVFVGVSVFMPYIGAVVVTIPVALVAFFQWGIEPRLFYFLVAYLVVQALDGNLLVPLIFSEAVNLHPVAIIVAILFFGDLWGVWGLFFAIPLAILLNALFSALTQCQARPETSS